MSHIIKDDKIYKGTSPSGNPLGNIKDKKWAINIYKKAISISPFIKLKPSK